ncbi:PH domain-containing protein [Brachybacterium sp. J153]|uniref:PH domain-containing protein n=1 Tax=Brachybacterium sp. J153 TaxID=3116488 RepID=UPI002E762591|nr:PH domain-containing protein [Brachybacterium sp. J153]MEE1619426.1 PH domain-containing protein [Brachybacterium sp. J153]
MTIPRQIGPETGPRTALPDYSRSSATVERMVAQLDGPRRRTGGGNGQVRALLPAAATRDTLLRGAVGVLALGVALAALIGVIAVWLTVPEGHSPDIGRLLLMLTLALLALIVGLLGLRFAWVALATARARVEIGEDSLLVVGALRSRRVPWDEILAIESRVVHPVHWLTAALRLRDGSRVLMPAFDRHIWSYSRPTGEDVRGLRRELHERELARHPRR